MPSTFCPRKFLSSLSGEQIAELADILLTRDPSLNQAEAADYLGISTQLLRHWRVKNTGPAWIGPSSANATYRQSVLTAFRLSREIPTHAFPNLSPETAHVFRFAMGLEATPRPRGTSSFIRAAADRYSDKFKVRPGHTKARQPRYKAD